MSVETPNFTIRRMKVEDISQILDLWKEAGMTEGTYSIHTWFQYDPEGFYVAATEDGLVVGSCGGVILKEDLAFMGLYIVRPEFRNRGIGRKIWKIVDARLGDRNIGVNPVPEQLENYRDRSGFPVQDNWNSVIYTVDKVDLTRLRSQVEDIKVRLIDPDDRDTIDDVIKYDQDIIGFSRAKLVTLLCAQPEAITLVARTGNGEVCGYGCTKKDIEGNVLVGPLYADSQDIAELILHKLAKGLKNGNSTAATFFSIDSNPGAMRLMEKLEGVEKERVCRLYRKEKIRVKHEKIYYQYNLNFSIY